MPLCGLHFFFVGLFLYRNAQRRGHVEFIRAALRSRQEYGVHKDLEVYKRLLDIFPKGKMVPENMLQVSNALILHLVLPSRLQNCNFHTFSHGGSRPRGSGPGGGGGGRNKKF